MIAPSVNLFVFRPAIVKPALATYNECKKSTLSEILDMHEIIDLRSSLDAQGALNDE